MMRLSLQEFEENGVWVASSPGPQLGLEFWVGEGPRKMETWTEDGKWRIRAVVRHEEGLWEIEELYISPAEPGQTLSGAVLRAIPLGHITSRLSEATFDSGPSADEDLINHVISLAHHDDEMYPPSGRRGYAESVYIYVALLYLDLHGKVPTRELHQQISWGLAEAIMRQLTPQQTRDLVRGARKRKYLTEGRPGRAGAEPGPALQEWIALWKERREARAEGN